MAINNSIYKVDKYVASLLKNKEEAHMYNFNVMKKLAFVCPRCHRDFLYYPKEVVSKNGSVRCPFCGDGISYPEKFIHNMLKQLNVTFKTQFNSSNEKWCGKYRYDVFIQNSRTIIEIHGLQHYEDKKWKISLSEIQNIDNAKKQLALSNNIKNYIVIDAKYSDPIYLKNNILSSSLSKLYDLSIIDWDMCSKYACSSMVVKACEMFDSYIDCKTIIKELHICRQTLMNYLYQGDSSGFIKKRNFQEYIYGVKHRKRTEANGRKKIMNVETGDIYNSIAEAERFYNNDGKKHFNISANLRGVQKSAYGYHWKYI